MTQQENGEACAAERAAPDELTSGAASGIPIQESSIRSPLSKLISTSIACAAGMTRGSPSHAVPCATTGAAIRGSQPHTDASSDGRVRATPVDATCPVVAAIY